jgi:PKD repeat protein
MILRRTFLLFAVILTYIGSYSQGQEGHNWYFGDNASATWCINNTPVALTGSALNTNEGCASISDPFCNTLFYTDGITVWNSFHIPMPNSMNTSAGGPLHGDPSATQSGVIVPKPLDPDIYYVFTVDANLGTYGCAYSVVDMTLMGGLGDVVPGQKNIPLFTPSSEKISAVNHANGFDIWVITHPWNSGSFWTYLVTNAGVSATPISSTTGTFYTGGSAGTRGYMKASPSGNLIATGIEGMDKFELFSFNDLTGVLSLVHSFPTNYQDAYGVEYSPDGTYLYGSRRWGNPVFQWNVTTLTAPAIMSSQVQIATLSTSYGGALQLAPDNKIYLARNNQTYLGVINDPNVQGVLCNYVEPGLVLAPGTSSSEGLPTFIASFFNIAEYSFLKQCEGDSTVFHITNTNLLDSAFWNFDDPGSGLNDTSTLWTVNHVFSDSGHFDVMLITYRGGYPDTAIQEIEIFAYPEVNIQDTVICLGASVLLDAGWPDMEYFWSTSAYSQTINVTPYDTTTYWVEVDNNGCVATDTATIYPYYITADFIVDPILCKNDFTTVTYTGNALANATYNWSFNGGNVASGAGAGPYNLNWWTPGEYTLTLDVMQGSCVSSVNTITIINPEGLEVAITGEDVPCSGEATGSTAVEITGNNGPFEFLWSNGSNDQDLVNVEAGWYSLIVTYNSICSDTADYTINEPAAVVGAQFTGNDIVCYGETTGIASVNGTGGVGPYTYEWSLNSQTSQMISNLEAGYYIATVTDSHNCVYINGVLINEPDELQLFGTADQIICNGQETSIQASAAGGVSPYTFTWTNVGTGDTVTVDPTESTEYGVFVEDAAGNPGCKAGPIYSVVNVWPNIKAHPFAFRDTICPGDSTIIYASFTGGMGDPYTAYDEFGEVLEFPMTVKPEITTTYFIKGTDECNSPADSGIVTVFVMDVPEPDLEPDVVFGCEPLTVKFSYEGSGDNLNYLWSFSDGVTEHVEYESSRNPEHLFLESGTYTVDLKVSNEWGCKASTKVSDLITVYEQPTADFLPDPASVPITKPIVFFDNYSGNFLNCTWDFGDGYIIESSSPVLSHAYSDTGVYYVTLIVEKLSHEWTDPSGTEMELYCTDTLTMDVHVFEESVFFAPNAFNPHSPNAENAVFKPMLFGWDFREYHLVIYDRWGEKIFETYDKDRAWDGRIKNGSLGSPDVYSWIVTFKDSNNRKQIKNGNVALIR